MNNKDNAKMLLAITFCDNASSDKHLYDEILGQLYCSYSLLEARRRLVLRFKSTKDVQGKVNAVIKILS